jgi:hypothetical protein
LFQPYLKIIVRHAFKVPVRFGPDCDRTRWDHFRPPAAAASPHLAGMPEPLLPAAMPSRSAAGSAFEGD